MAPPLAAVSVVNSEARLRVVFGRTVTAGMVWSGPKFVRRLKDR